MSLSCSRCGLGNLSTIRTLLQFDLSIENCITGFSCFVCLSVCDMCRREESSTLNERVKWVIYSSYGERSNVRLLVSKCVTAMARVDLTIPYTQGFLYKITLKFVTVFLNIKTTIIISRTSFHCWKPILWIVIC